MFRKQILIFISLLLFLYSCGESPKKGEILYLDAQNSKISYKIVDLPNIVDIDHLKSTYFDFLAGGFISMYVTEELTSESTIGKLNDLMLQDNGVVPTLRYRVENDAIIPYTLDDTMMLTLYYNMNQAMDFFVDLGLPLNKGANNDSWGKMKVMFELEMEIEDHKILDDNAFYYPFMQIMAFLKQSKLKFLSMVANPMIVTHEFAHSIFDFYATGRIQEDELLSKYNYDPNKHSDVENCRYMQDTFYLAAMNEGFSDYWGSLKVGRSDIIYLSITKNALQVNEYPESERNLEEKKGEYRKLTPKMLLKCDDDIKTKSQYWAGTIWASSLWEINKLNIDPNFNRYLLESYKCLNSYFKSGKKIDLLVPGNCLVKTLKEKSVNTDKVCSILNNRFHLLGGFDECK